MVASLVSSLSSSKRLPGGLVRAEAGGASESAAGPALDSTCCPIWGPGGLRGAEDGFNDSRKALVQGKLARNMMPSNHVQPDRFTGAVLTNADP